MKEPSPCYLKALDLTRRHHEEQNKTFSGQFTWKRRKRIKTIIDRFGCKTILDYGCGKGKQYDPAFNRDKDGHTLEEFWGISPTRYDPGVKAYSAEPIGKFDLVICVQVLAAIPTADLPWVIDRLYGFADKAIFVAERIKAPNKAIYKSMADEMPRELEFEDWEMLLRRPGSPIRLVGIFHGTDLEEGPKSWRLLEPEDQGPHLS